MDLKRIIKVSDDAVKRECSKRKWRVNSDVLQEARIKAWLAGGTDNYVQPQVLRAIAKHSVIDQMRSELKRTNKKVKIVSISTKDWGDIPNESSENTKIALVELDFIEEKLDGEERLVFRHLRRGHSIPMISRALGWSESTGRRAVASVIQRAQEIGKVRNEG